MDNGAQHREDLARTVVTDCRACRVVCEQTLGYVRPKETSGPSELVRSLVACAAAAESVARSIEDGGTAMQALLEFCTETCETVAAECARAGDDEQLRVCADVCRGCGDTVRALLWEDFEPL